MDADMLFMVVRTFEGSDADATDRLYRRLESLGPLGAIAVNLFRAQKTSSRAKVYRGRGFRGSAYGRKQWSMQNLDEILAQHGDANGIGWGWGEDLKQPLHKWVLYVDLPTGQVSFHTAERGTGPEYRGQWDGVPGRSTDRICRWVARLLSPEVTHA